MKEVFVVQLRRFGQETEILRVCSSLKRAKIAILEYLQMIHFDNGLTKLDVNQFVERHLESFDEDFKSISFPDDFDIIYSVVDMD